MNLYNNFIETKFLDFLNRYLDVPLKKKGYQVLSVNISQPVIEPSQALEKGLIYEYIIEVNYQSPSGIDLKMNLGIPKLNTGLFIIFGKHKTPTLRLISEDRIRFEPDLFVIDYNRSYCYSTNKIKYIDSTGTETIVELDSMDELPIEFSKLDDYLVKKLSIKMEKDFNLILTKDDLFTIKDKFIGVHDRDWDHILDKKVQTIQSALVSTFNSSKKEIYTRITGDLNEFAPKAKIVHIDVDTASISRNVVVDVPIVADANVALDKLNEWAEPKKTAEWQKQIKAWDEENPLGMRRDKGMTPQMIMEHINKNYKDAIYVTDVGQHQMWATQYLELDSNSQLLTSGGLGTMGFGLPAAIGAKIANPDKDVVCISGDGGLQMNIQELATSVVQGAGVTICVLNNYYLGMVRQMQQLFYGKRYSATCLRRRKGCPAECKGPNEACPPYTPDFIKLVESYGGHGIRVEKEEDIDAAFAEAKKYKDVPVIIEFMIATDEIVLPMVKSGNPMSEMILK
jgi:hypothetical protein